jgi:WD40 repeat protein
MFNLIKNPKTGRFLKINTKQGKALIRNYQKFIQMYQQKGGDKDLKSKMFRKFSSFSSVVKSVAFNKGKNDLNPGTKIVSGFADKTIRILNVDTGELEKTFEGHIKGVLSVGFNHDGTKIVSGSSDNTIRIWNVDTGELEKTLEGHTDSVRSVGFNHDGTKIVSGSLDNTIRVWNLATDELEKILEGHTDRVFSVEFNYDGTQIVSGSRDQTIRVWNSQNGQCVTTLKGHSDFVYSVSFSPDGQWIASGSWDKTIRVWNIHDSFSHKILEGHKGRIWSVGFNHDGTKIVSGSSDTTICVWNVHTAKCILTLSDHIGWTTSVTFNHDGTKIASGSNQTILVSNLEETEVPEIDSFIRKYCCLGDCVRLFLNYSNLENLIKEKNSLLLGKNECYDFKLKDQEGIDSGGVTRQFCTDISQELIEKKYLKIFGSGWGEKNQGIDGNCEYYFFNIEKIENIENERVVQFLEILKSLIISVIYRGINKGREFYLNIPFHPLILLLLKYNYLFIRNNLQKVLKEVEKFDHYLFTGKSTCLNQWIINIEEIQKQKETGNISSMGLVTWVEYLESLEEKYPEILSEIKPESITKKFLKSDNDNLDTTKIIVLREKNESGKFEKVTYKNPGPDPKRTDGEKAIYFMKRMTAYNKDATLWRNAKTILESLNKNNAQLELKEKWKNFENKQELVKEVFDYEMKDYAFLLMVFGNIYNPPESDEEFKLISGYTHNLSIKTEKKLDPSVLEDIKKLSLEDLQTLISGKSEITPEMYQEFKTKIGFTGEVQYSLKFIEFLDQKFKEDPTYLNTLLSFSTGLKNLPPKLDNFYFEVTINTGLGVPKAHTCFNQFVIYADLFKDENKDKLDEWLSKEFLIAQGKTLELSGGNPYKVLKILKNSRKLEKISMYYFILAAISKYQEFCEKQEPIKIEKWIDNKSDFTEFFKSLIIQVYNTLPYEKRLRTKMKTFYGHTSFVSSVGLNHDGTKIVSGSGHGDKTIRVWNVDTGECILILKGHTDTVNSVGFNIGNDDENPGTKIVSGSDDKTIRVWNVDTGEYILTLEGHTDGVASVGYNHNGTKIVSGSWDKTIRIWNVDKNSDKYGKCILTLEGHIYMVKSVVFNHDGTKIVSGSGDKTIRVWNVDTGECILTLKGHTGFVKSVGFNIGNDDENPGTKIVSGSGDKTIRVWNVDKNSDKYGECILTLKGHTDEVYSVGFNHDGTKIVSGSGHQYVNSADNTIRVWNVDTGECILTLKGHTREVSSVGFNYDGTKIVSGSGDKTIRVWNAQTGEQEKILEGRIKEKISFKLIQSSLENAIKIFMKDLKGGKKKRKSKKRKIRKRISRKRISRKSRKRNAKNK